jgi:hypothetical protein
MVPAIAPAVARRKSSVPKRAIRVFIVVGLNKERRVKTYFNLRRSGALVLLINPQRVGKPDKYNPHC